MAVPVRAQPGEKKGKSMSKTYILVHGAWLSSWCWDGVKTRMEATGAKVIAPDLVAHGTDGRPISAATLDAYVDQIAGLVSAQSEPVVLVGHSMGGVVISGVAEKVPDRIQKLVYLAAYLLEDGQSIMDASKLADDSQAAPNFEFAPDYSTASIKRDALVAVFAVDAPAADQALLLDRARPEPLAPFQGKLSLTAARYGKVPRAYIETARDLVITPKAQAAMLKATPTSVIATLPTSHTPFFADPDGTARAIASA
jgi:pimeloyl-ACP methyl ester carboxylesterase